MLDSAIPRLLEATFCTPDDLMTAEIGPLLVVLKESYISLITMISRRALEVFNPELGNVGHEKIHSDLNEL